MTIRNKLKNNLVRKIQKLSADKLNELDVMLNKTESELQSKEKTVKMTGSWKELDTELFSDLTDQLHSHRTQDRQIN